MAFAAPDQNQTVPGQPTPAQGQAPIASGGAGVGGASKAVSTPGQNVPAQPSAQLSAYLAANQPQAAALGQNVAQTVGGQVNAAGAAITPAVNTYTGQLYTVPTDTTVNNLVSTSPSSLTAGAPSIDTGGLGQSGARNGGQVGGPAPNQQEIFQQELGAAAAAPNSSNTFETSQGYADATAGIQNAVEQANLWNAGNDVGSLSTALTPFEGPNATTGDKTLDSLLLSQTPGAYQQIQSAVAPASGLQSELNAGTTAADASLNGAIAQDTATTAAAQGTANNYLTNLSTYLNSTVSADQAAQNAITLSPSQQSALYASLGSGAGIGDTHPAILAALGITPQQAAALNSEVGTAQQPQEWYGQNNTPEYTSPAASLSLNKYLTQNGATVPDIGNVASSQNFSDVSALEKMLSAAGYSSPVSNPLSGLDPSQAGTFNTSPNDQFNYTGALNDVNQIVQDQNAAMFAKGYTQTPTPTQGTISQPSPITNAPPPVTPTPAPVIINGPTPKPTTPPTITTNPPVSTGGPTTITIDPGNGQPPVTVPVLPPGQGVPLKGTIGSGGDQFAGLAQGGMVGSLKDYLGAK